MSEDQKHIEQLLQKYLEAKTSLEEESQLHRFLAKSNSDSTPGSIGLVTCSITAVTKSSSTQILRFRR